MQFFRNVALLGCVCVCVYMCSGMHRYMCMHMHVLTHTAVFLKVHHRGRELKEFLH